jgi:hypothetical protein
LLVTWGTTNLIGTQSVRGLVIDTTGGALGSSFPILGSASLSATNPACSGDGANWVVTCSTSSTLLGTGAACVPVRFTNGVAAVGSPRTLVGPSGNVRDLAVASLGTSAFVVMSSAGAVDNDISVRSVDPFTCSDCEGSLLVDASGNGIPVAISTRANASVPTFDGAIVYVPFSAGQGDVALRLFTAIDGQTVELDLGCTLGEVIAPCARAGNGNFGVQLRNGPTNELTLAIHSVAAMNFPCANCTVVPDTAVGIISFAGITSVDGAITAPLPLPSGPGVVGATIYSQFVLLGGNCLGAFRTTEALAITLQ